jgi:hypothetical protein
VEGWATYTYLPPTYLPLHTLPNRLRRTGQEENTVERHWLGYRKRRSIIPLQGVGSLCLLGLHVGAIYLSGVEFMEVLSSLAICKPTFNI